MTRRLSLEEATGLAARACRAAGLSDEAALSLARATVSADAHGKGSIGFSHLIDYLAASRAGRIVGDAEPLLTSPAPAAIHCDAQRRDRAARLRPRLRRSSPPRRDLRDRAVRARRKLHHRRTRLLPAPSRGGRPRRFRRDQRAGADDGRRARRSPSIAPTRSPSPRRSTKGRRCSSTRRRARPPLSSSGTMPSAARRCPKAGRSTPMASRPPIRRRRCAARCWRSAARAAPISR